MEKNTSRLATEILRAKDMDAFDSSNAEAMIDPMGLGEFLSDMLELHGKTKKDIIQKSSIDTTYGYQIFQGKKKHPSRDRLLCLAFAFPLTVEETKRLLYYGGCEALYPRVRRDAYLMFALHNGYTLVETNLYLEDHGERAIGVS
ncbi:MAG: XRE family transcriptional regulator [Eubacterium sp.]|nr:XRE family transcriptional regulator [Eubacterium sp.]